MENPNVEIKGECLGMVQGCNSYLHAIETGSSLYNVHFIHLPNAFIESDAQIVHVESAAKIQGSEVHASVLIVFFDGRR